MKHAGRSITTALALLALAAALATPMLAHADDYGDVNQLMRSGKLTEALALANRYIAAKPKDPQMRFLKGVVLTEAGRKEDAIATYAQLIEDYPELPEPYNNIAVLYAGQNQFDKARAALESAVRANPGYATAHENLGDVYARLAGQSFAKAQQLDANNLAVQSKLAVVRQLASPAPAQR
jgi:Flp pilus assembly protein TadD